MIGRWNRCMGQKYWILCILTMGCLLSVTAWLFAVPSIHVTAPITATTRSRRRRRYSPSDLASKVSPDDNENDKDKRTGPLTPIFLGIGGGGSGDGDGGQKKRDNKNDDQRKQNKETRSRKPTEKPKAKAQGEVKSKQKEKQKQKQKEVYDGDETGGGLFKSFIKRFDNRREAKQAKEVEKQKELDAVLQRESGASAFNFNTSSITSVFENVESQLTKARAEFSSIRTVPADTNEERRLDVLRAAQAARMEKQLQAQREADQRAKERREKQIKEKEERELKQKQQREAENDEKASNDKKSNRSDKKSNKNIADNDDDDVDGNSSNKNDDNGGDKPRSNPLSAAQNFVSNLIDKQKSKETWIVVAPKTRISPGEIVPITAAGLDLLLVASKDGSDLHCVANSCPHLGTPLEIGSLERRPMEINESSPFEKGRKPSELRETDIANLLAQDGCEDCIVCPLHKTAFALNSGEVRGEWCPYPPVLGKVVGAVKRQSALPVFGVRVRGKNIEVRINTPFEVD